MCKLIISLLLCISVSWSNQQPTIETSLGTVTGYYKSSYDGRTYSAFEGIPYAKPPVDDLRFQEPQPASSWDGILNANASYTCLQMIPNGLGIIGQEDCLYLNVYVPKEQPSETDSFDVLVHIHGGAFMMGRGGMAGPSFFMDRDIIYVNFNYRLGLLGFLSTEDDVVPGNNGLKDQQLALKWIQSNIKRFGGNPNSVTLIGLSAGAASVHFHYFSPLSKGLFHRGISSSGTVLMPWAIQKGALEKAKKLGELSDCNDPQMRKVIDCLKKVPGNELIGKTLNFYEFSVFPLAVFAPVVEKNSHSAFLTEHPYQLLLKREFNDVPWMTSLVMDEGMYPTVVIETKLDEINKNWNTLLQTLLDYKYMADESAKLNIPQKIKEYYFENEVLSLNNIDKLVKLFSDRYFIMGFETAIQMQAIASKSPVYAYIYNYEIDFGLAKFYGSTLKGTSHGDDAFLMYDVNMFGTPMEKKILSPSDATIKNVLVDLVTSFVTDGNPQVKGINWEPMTHEKFNYLYIPNIDEISMFESGDIIPTRKFWESLGIKEFNLEPELRDEL